MQTTKHTDKQKTYKTTASFNGSSQATDFRDGFDSRLKPITLSACVVHYDGVAADSTSTSSICDLFHLRLSCRFDSKSTF